jgi:hypothetical protein
MSNRCGGQTNYNEYERLKILFSKTHSDFMKGNIPWNKNKIGLQKAWNKGLCWSDEVKAKIAKAHKDKVLTQEHKDKISVSTSGSKNAMFGLIGDAHPKTGFEESDITKQRKSDASKGVPKSDAHKNSIKESWENREYVQCTHCEMISRNKGNMNRYHFDNCKFKKD